MTASCTFQKIVVEVHGHSKQEAKNRSAAQMIVILADGARQKRTKPVEIKPLEGSTLMAIEDNISHTNTESNDDDTEVETEAKSETEAKAEAEDQVESSEVKKPDFAIAELSDSPL